MLDDLYFSVVAFGFIITTLYGTLKYANYKKSTIESNAVTEGQIQNWGKTQRFTPKRVEFPTTRNELIQSVNNAAKDALKIRAIGSLHSWSACAVVDGGVALRLDKLDNILGIDKTNRRVKIEAGAKLAKLYEVLRQNGMALPSIPNVNCITIGGGISNAVHGTCKDAGTLCDYVEELEMVVFKDNKAQMIQLRRDTKDPEEYHLFEGAITSFGSLGILYSVTFQCQESFNLFVTHKIYLPERIENKFLRIATEHYSAQIHVFPFDAIGVKTLTPISTSILTPTTADFRSSVPRVLAHYFMWANEPQGQTIFHKICKYLFYFGFTNRFSRYLYTKPTHAEVLDWSSAEIESIIPLIKRNPWVNLEYAIPVEELPEVMEKLLGLYKFYKENCGYNRLLPFTVRPVGPDRAGYLCPTKGRATAFIDIPYDMAWEEKTPKAKFFSDVENVLLQHKGRVSWSRLFLSSPDKFLPNYPELEKFVDVKNKLDPTNIFSNAFSDMVLQRGI